MTLLRPSFVPWLPEDSTTAMQSYTVLRPRTLTNSSVSKIAMVVSKTNRRYYITPVLSDLHWLPVRYRIEYKIALLTYWQFSNRSICQSPFVSTRLQDSYDLAVPTSCSTVQQFLTFRSVFCYASPTIWNNLPETVFLILWHNCIYWYHQI